MSARQLGAHGADGGADGPYTLRVVPPEARTGREGLRARAPRARRRWRFAKWGWTWLAVCGALCACGEAAPTSSVAGPVSPARCAQVSSFGSGAMCAPPQALSEVDLGACVGQAPACSAGRLCFESAQVLACTCERDDHCQGYASYVNSARAALAQDALPPSCVDGRCVADLDGAHPGAEEADTRPR